MGRWSRALRIRAATFCLNVCHPSSGAAFPVPTSSMSLRDAGDVLQRFQVWSPWQERRTPLMTLEGHQGRLSLPEWHHVIVMLSSDTAACQ